MEDCIFCKIIRRELPGKILHEDESVIAIEDIRPQAPIHLLVLPKAHIETLGTLKPGDQALIGRMFAIVAKLAKERGIESRGYRTVINNGPGAGQSVYHLHVHLLGGRVLHWPPG
jgi:histidine triad (HIT) family protein